MSIKARTLQGLAQGLPLVALATSINRDYRKRSMSAERSSLKPVPARSHGALTPPRAKKVLFVITKSNWGGAQAYVFALAKRAKDAGHDVTVALGGKGTRGASPGRLEEELRAERIRTVFLPSLARDISLFREFKVLQELSQTLGRERPDVLHLNSSKAGGLGGFAGRVAGVPRIIFTSHGLAYDEDRPFSARVFIWLFTWLTFVFAHRIILISEDTYRRASRLPFVGRKTCLIYNGLAPIPFATREQARLNLFPSVHNVPWIGTIAEFTRNKGLMYLIEAAALLKKRGLEFRLCLIGDGEDASAIKRLIQQLDLTGHIFLPGFVPNAARNLKAFEIFALTSVKEGLPYVLLEAGQAGCAVVGSRIPGITDIIDDSTGILVEPRNTQAIASALQTLLCDGTRRQQLGEALRARVLKRFSFDQMIQETTSLYTS